MLDDDLLHDNAIIKMTEVLKDQTELYGFVIESLKAEAELETLRNQQLVDTARTQDIIRRTLDTTIKDGVNAGVRQAETNILNKAVREAITLTIDPKTAHESHEVLTHALDYIASLKQAIAENEEEENNQIEASK